MRLRDGQCRASSPVQPGVGVDIQRDYLQATSSEERLENAGLLVLEKSMTVKVHMAQIQWDRLR